MITFVWPIVGLFLIGVVLKDLWLWFVVPVFGLPELSIVQAIGIALVWDVIDAMPPSIVYGYQIKDDKEKAKEFSYFIIIANGFRLLVLWGIGWLLKTMFL